MRDMQFHKQAQALSIVAVAIGFGAMAGAVHLFTTEGDDHGDDWQALHESGQADLITDFSSSLWMPDATDHAVVPSVKELLFHITLFQRELWFGEISDSPEVVQIVQHCLPQKKRADIEAQCTSVAGLGT